MMMLIEIKHRFTDNVLYACEAENMKAALVKAVDEGADLRGAYLEGADLRGAYLAGADLEGADLRGAYLEGADLEGADLRGAYLEGADLRGVYLRGADLRGADLRGVYLRGVYLRGADLRGAYLRGADLEGEKLTIAPISILNLTWDILITESYLEIGCERHTHEEWKTFSDDEINKMERRALAFWKVNKSWVLAACRTYKKEAKKAKK